MARKRIKRKKKNDFWLLTMVGDNKERHQLIMESEENIAREKAKEYIKYYSKEFKINDWYLRPQSYWALKS